MTLKAILFDHDGTLVDSEYAHYDMWREILSQQDITLSQASYTQNYAGIPTKTNAQSIVKNYSLDVSADQLIAAKTALTEQYLAQQAFPLMDGARQVMDYFYQRGFIIGIVTGASRQGVETTLAKHQLGNYVSVVVSGDDVKDSKPAADCYLLAAATLGLKTSECLAIEDTYQGSMSAFNANIRCIGVSQSSQVRQRFTTTIYSCHDLHAASAWISENCI